MHILSAVTVAALFSRVSFAAVVPNTHYVHEKRASAPTGFSKRDPLKARGALDKRSILPLKIALKQSNLHLGDAWLHEVSSPFSDKYGQHWTPDQVRDAFAPSDVTIKAVRDWLVHSGIDPGSIRQSASAGFLEFKVSISEAEELLKTKYQVWESNDEGADRQHLACDEYSLPQHLKDHVDFVMPTLRFDVPLEKRANKRPPTTAVSNALMPLSDGPALTPAGTPGCDAVITPSCLQQLYSFPNGSTALVKNAVGVPEFQNYYQGKDLDLFFKAYTNVPQGKRPIFVSIDGGVNETSQDYDSIAEANLDLSVVMSLVYPQNVTLYQTGDPVEEVQIDTFLDAVGPGYCTLDGGDDPNIDPTYPDNSTQPGAYKGQLECGTVTPAKIISLSYTGSEGLPYNFHYNNRQCQEYMKLGLMGTSFFVASSDYGVASGSAFGAQCYSAGPGSDYENSEDGGRFVPSFPSTCPYVTSVGATQVIPGTNITAALASGKEPEEASTPFASGGGFSDYFAIPQYQNTTVLAYFKNHKPPYSSAQYNNTQKSRAYPDLSANGVNYSIPIGGTFMRLNGTSASTPTVASIFALINEKRAAANKSAVGFVNPVLYANPQAFNDITKGNNPGCNTTGFAAVSGWDPVTGLGTPIYQKLLSVFMNLS